MSKPIINQCKQLTRLAFRPTAVEFEELALLQRFFPPFPNKNTLIMSRLAPVLYQCTQAPVQHQYAVVGRRAMKSREGEGAVGTTAAGHGGQRAHCVRYDHPTLGGHWQHIGNTLANSPAGHFRAVSHRLPVCQGCPLVSVHWYRHLPTCIG